MNRLDMPSTRPPSDPKCRVDVSPGTPKRVTTRPPDRLCRLDTTVHPTVQATLFKDGTPEALRATSGRALAAPQARPDAPLFDPATNTDK